MSGNVARQRNDNRWHAAPEWYTPAWLMARVAAFLGPGYADPCPASHGKMLENGLAIPWRGRMYVNPPYGKPISAWVIKAMTEPVQELIMLVPAYTDTRWFAPLFEHTLCFIKGRVAFDIAGQSRTKEAPHPSVLVYRGRRYRKFAQAFCDLGPILRQYEPRKARQPLLLEATA